MLVSLKEILNLAEARKIAIGSFNAPNLASLNAVLNAAEELNEPVIITHAQLHEDTNKLCKLEEIGPIMLMAADRASVPVCVHLDHGTDLAYIKRGLDLGFTSVMYDGSDLAPEENLANTRITVELAARYGVSVEAEIGSMGVRGTGLNEDDSIYTNPEAAAEFVDATGIDALACAFGTVHGVHLKEPKLDFPRLDKIAHLVPVPLVMHGGSGVSDEDYKKVIELGIRKINYYTYMAIAGAKAVAAMENPKYYHDIALVAEQAMKEDSLRAMRLFTNK